MASEDPGRPARTPRLIRVLIGSTVAAACVGGGVASAQTATTTDDAATTTTATGTTTDATTTSTMPSTDTGSGDAATQDTTTDGGAGTDSSDTASARRGRLLRLRLEATSPGKVFFTARKKVHFRYKIGGDSRQDIKIQVVKTGSGKVVRRWQRDNVRPGDRQRVGWSGARKGGGDAPKGKYYFRVKDSAGRPANRRRAKGKRSFHLYSNKFPVRGRHQYWDGFGAGRGHQGQDVGAACGTPIVAARAGQVKVASYDGGGYGYYVIINTKAQNRAHVYGHLRNRPRVHRGQHVKTGQKLGAVGQTGNATGCHLHFEYWEGSWPSGHASPRVTKRLKHWDHWS